MLRQFLLPDPGEGLLEAEIAAWRVTEGETVEVNDVLVEIETAKSLVELPSPWAGRVHRLLIAEGVSVEVGTAIVEIDDGEAEVAAAESVPNLVGYGPNDGVRSRRRRSSNEPDNSAEMQQAMRAAYEPHEPGRRSDEVNPASQVTAEPIGDPLPTPGKAPTESQLVLASDPGAVRAKPPVRKYAQDLGVDLTKVIGTGPDGSITRGDVEAAAAFSQQPKVRVVNDQASFTAGNGPSGAGFSGAAFGAEQGAGGFDPFQGRSEYRVPIKGVRKLTAENMVKSVTTHVHVTEWLTTDVTKTMDFVEALKLRREFAGLRISPLVVYAKAICLALGRNPELNTSWDEQTQEIVYHRDVNLGIAAATPRGLMVPNIKAAQNLSLLQLCQAINQLVAISRDGKLQPADYSNGSFTITNVGVFGVDSGTPIINGDESAIFCMGSIQRRPWVIGQGETEQVVPRWVTTCSVAFDHRIIDGEQGSQFLRDVADVLADPATALLY